MAIKIIKNIKPKFVDERGGITKLLDDGKTVIKSILLITSKKGSVRGNHYHKKDSHYVYMISGKMKYTEQSMKGKNRRKESIIVKEGDMVYSAPMVAHAMLFLEDSVFIALATESRHQKAYEEDTKRINIV